MKNIPGEFVSCDWGTSNFRLRHISTETLDILSENSTGMDIKKLHERFIGRESTGRFQFFADYLLSQLDRLATLKDSEVNTVVISGMASSSIGMLELEYASMPIDESGNSLLSRMIPISEEITSLLVSGVKTADDVMRGEETQALGLLDYIPKDGRGILLLPGTHSKHLEFNGGCYRDFRTFITGELYQVLSTHSILRNSVEKEPWNEFHENAFLDGVQQGASHFAASLFKTRTRELLGKQTREQNGSFLSGLLIGSEISYLGAKTDPVYLAAPNTLSSLYRLALETLLGEDRVSCLAEAVLAQALLSGQKKILLSQL